MSATAALRLHGCKWRWLQQGCGCNRRKTGQRAEEDNGGIERETATSRVHIDVGRDQDSWQRKIAAGCDVDRLQRKIAAGSFLPQRIAVGCDQAWWQREIAASSIVQREMRATVEGIREIGRLKGWWTEGGRLRIFWACFLAIFGCGLGLRFGGVLGL
ncbi:hypothetical protein GW17_00062299 [Ensete ventricosum]|nr:hypothetical protein GW17_00062299 [Ensete ventricosum]RZS16889.1 hypothetical protein BHM03_00048958 [Ensete ventricosum]